MAGGVCGGELCMVGVCMTRGVCMARGCVVGRYAWQGVMCSRWGAWQGQWACVPGGHAWQGGHVW